MRTLAFIFFVVCFFGAFAEGTKELMPHNKGKCYVQFNESFGGQRYFARVGADSIDRLYIHIANVGEVINLGFKKTKFSSGGAEFCIKDPSGNVVYDFEDVPADSRKKGYIKTYGEAKAGPNTLKGGNGGYTPITYTTNSKGDYYIEFKKTSAKTTRYLFEYFDITVSSGTKPIKGRVWAYAWDLNTENYSNSSYANFYVYSDDKYVTKVNLNGLKPYSFVIACNNTGAQNAGDLFKDRQSVDGKNTMFPKYKIFLNEPDPNVYDVATVPKMKEKLQVVGVPNANEPVEFYINMTTGGTLELYLDIDGVPGYQIGGKDVAIVEKIEPGGDYIYWDGNDGLGNHVTKTTTIFVTSRFSTGVTHLPLYDAEQNPNGFRVTRIAPGKPEDLVLYWDDSKIKYGKIPADQEISMFDGNTTANGHIWTKDLKAAGGTFGNDNTINTWWNAYEIDDLLSFGFIYLPIELTDFFAEFVPNKGVDLFWETATETNNDYFVVQRSLDGQNWEDVVEIQGGGTTSSASNYDYCDIDFATGLVYYRLMQVDFDGTFTYSEIIAVDVESAGNNMRVVKDETGQYLIISANSKMVNYCGIYDLQGHNHIYSCPIIKETNSEITFNITNLPQGIYFVVILNEAAFKFIK